ncbi:FtsW/RodA/SpoVE family cell cycle protein [Microbacterium azadirachtae]|uniref:FtsW/RodA/SpoVE family cell cycle protein n=1 Tax=Microbacterium azadirachtae TaxID=582680 RepID=UPI0008907EF9|nr:FtsW/RodA/SpoVE family cell cycle protein [Microbacterium azadirachtae]UXW85999.1 FtsW/RodA/SpoVE family cell cycle protein [Microbacterium azadirachtae]SDL66237.1 cell division protein FtsW, lipid II flippase [Microbacterium azadirachtae]SEF95646.1 cell division protein FtsW, lipid II flippase [Microbacterium azadirachtae]SEF98133.1 cell division protein FtsW, lipid II flippase [Microbacterium azadirachtae]
MTATAPASDVAADTAVLRALRRIRGPQTQRNREFWLLLFAVVVAGSALTLVQLGALHRIDPMILLIGGGLAVLVFALHVVLRFVASDADPFVLPIATLLTGVGIAEIYRIDIANHATGWNASSNKQLMWMAISVIGAIALVIFLRNYRVLYRYTYLSGLAGLVLLVLPFIPGLRADANADVWISIGGLGFQPGELSKIFLAIFFAGYLVRTRESLSSVGKRFAGITWPRMRELGPVIVVWLISLAIIVAQHDLGTGVLIFGMFIVMLYVATGKTSWVLIGLAGVVIGIAVVSQFLTYVQNRFNTWIHAFDPDLMEDQSYQLTQGIFGLAHGGLIGTGLGQGRPEITPVAESDFIITSLGEEIGLIGLFALLCLYMVFVSRGLRIGVAGQDDFGKLLAVGVSFTIGLQVFIMVGGVTRVIPLTGLTTPFLAAGGSSLIANWLIVGLLLRISDGVRRQPRVVIG